MERQRRLQREMSDRFAKSHALRTEQERIEQRMQDLEREFQVCQDKLRDIKEKITVNEAVSFDDHARKPVHSKYLSIPDKAEASRATVERSELHPGRRSSHLDTAAVRRPGLSVYTGRPKPTIVEEDHVHPLKGKTYLCEDFPIIVKLDESWAEIWCHVCGANSTQRGFIAGLHGLLKHIQVRHKAQNPRIVFKELTNVCGLHFLDEDEFAAVCLREKEVIHRFEDDPDDKAMSDPISDRNFMRRAGAITGAQAPPKPAGSGPNGSSSTTEASEEGIVVRSHERCSPSRFMEHAQQRREGGSIDLNIKVEVRTDSEHEDEDEDELLGAGPGNDEEIVSVNNPRARKRLRLGDMLESDDEDGYVPC